MKSVVKQEPCGEVFGAMTSMPCHLPKGHEGLHEGKSATKGSVGQISWLIEIRRTAKEKGAKVRK